MPTSGSSRSLRSSTGQSSSGTLRVTWRFPTVSTSFTAGPRLRATGEATSRPRSGRRRTAFDHVSISSGSASSSYSGTSSGRECGHDVHDCGWRDLVATRRHRRARRRAARLAPRCARRGAGPARARRPHAALGHRLARVRALDEHRRDRRARRRARSARPGDDRRVLERASGRRARAAVPARGRAKALPEPPLSGLARARRRARRGSRSSWPVRSSPGSIAAGLARRRRF